MTGATGSPGISGSPGRAAAGFVRDARAADAAELARIQVASWQASFGGVVPAEVLDALSDDAAVARFGERWAEAIASPPTSRHKVLVAYAAGATGEPVGFASIGPATDEDRWPGTDGELYELHVRPGADDGHAGRLLHSVADTLAEDGFHTACTWALADDAKRVAFLTGAGWAPDGSQGNLDMGVKVPVIRLHTLLSPGANGVSPHVGGERSISPGTSTSSPGTGANRSTEYPWACRGAASGPA